jgi:hypothetical protein
MKSKHIILILAAVAILSTLGSGIFLAPLLWSKDPKVEIFISSEPRAKTIIEDEATLPAPELPIIKKPERLSALLEQIGASGAVVTHYPAPVDSQPLRISGSVVGIFMGDTHLGRGFDYYSKRKKNYLSGILDPFLT